MLMHQAIKKEHRGIGIGTFGEETGQCAHKCRRKLFGDAEEVEPGAFRVLKRYVG
jgi:hypothetical protein